MQYISRKTTRIRASANGIPGQGSGPFRTKSQGSATSSVSGRKSATSISRIHQLEKKGAGMQKTRRRSMTRNLGLPTSRLCISLSIRSLQVNSARYSTGCCIVNGEVPPKGVRFDRGDDPTPAEEDHGRPQIQIGCAPDTSSCSTISNDVRRCRGALKEKEKRRINTLPILAFDSTDEALLGKSFQQVKAFVVAMGLESSDRSGFDCRPYCVR